MERSKEGAGGERPPTIRGVAERAGVSKSLVSLVIQGSPRVSDAKRQAVLAAIDELGYRPNAAARSLVARRTHTVGVIVNDLRNPWFAEVLDGLNSVLHAHGLRMLMADGRLGQRTGEDFTRAFLELRVDGLVAVGTLPDPDALATAAARLPVVVAGTHEPRLPRVDTIANDDERGARLATAHLIGLGHRRIAHIAGRGSVGALRRRGFEAAMAEAGLVDGAVVEPGEPTEEGGYRAAVRLLGGPADGPRPTAVFAFNDICAVGALSAAQELGLDVPRDLSLIGCDNTYLARIRHLWLSSVNNTSGDMGRRAGRCLLERMAHPERAAERQLVAPSLEIRGTTAPPR
ncbi:LacI family DNA-binding transcriptional regulator [Streptomyces pinistramenti]|uniref:LacI family DNA-binding transcriptional regulator n=1 Tax=Streptomyces pinistramenti TaxID=2884812 RepID=UPI001D087C63|nr:LacI family DNA-binding transcriptional regulator [Streptomyces pinistramenti]MCB5908013.1 LacI family transcriptional regulator [Streptomyces pinistramenti]